MTYYVPDLRSMSSLRSYNNIEDARAYAIRKMEEAGVPQITIFKDKNRMTVAGHIERGKGVGFHAGKVYYFYYPADFKPSFSHEAPFFQINKNGSKKLRGGY